MSDYDRYYALIKRQEAKLDFAPSLLEPFEESVLNLGPNPSRTELARWLTFHGVKPSPTARAEAKWTAQTVADWSSFDGIEPTKENLSAFDEELAAGNKSKRKKRMRSFGFRVSAMLKWNEVEGAILYVRGVERHAFDEQRLQQHLVRICEVAQDLRAALRIPEGTST